MYHLNKEDLKWITLTEYVDVETGEILTKSEKERSYYTTGKSHKKIEENGNYRIKKYIYECRRNGQQKLW